MLLVVSLLGCGPKVPDSSCQYGSYFYSRAFERERGNIASVSKRVTAGSEPNAVGVQISILITSAQEAVSYQHNYRDMEFVRCADTTDVVQYYDRFGRHVASYNYNETKPVE